MLRRISRAMFFPMAMAPLALVACKSLKFNDDGSQKNVDSTPASEIGSPNPNGVGVYYFDGSGDDCNGATPTRDLTLICQLYHATARSPSRYYAGVKDMNLATDLGAITNRGVDQICDDLKNGQVKKVVLIGFSRGAISALIAANAIPKRCGSQGKDAVKWIGLLDPVETSVWTYGRELRDIGKARSLPDNVQGLFIRKDPIRTPNDQRFGFYETTKIVVAPGSGATLDERIVKDIRHGDLGRGIRRLRDEDGSPETKYWGEDFDAYRWLKQGAERAGVIFRGIKETDLYKSRQTNPG